MIVVVAYLEELFSEGLIYQSIYQHLILHCLVQDVCSDDDWADELLLSFLISLDIALAGKAIVEEFGCPMENVSEDAVIYFVFINFIRFQQSLYIFIIELLLASLVCIEKSRCEHSHVVKYLHYFFGLWLFVVCRSKGFLTSDEGLANDRMLTFYHQLEHESAHLARLTIFRSIVVGKRDVVGTLQHTVKVVGKDGYLVFYGGETVSFAQGVGDE